MKKKIILCWCLAVLFVSFSTVWPQEKSGDLERAKALLAAGDYRGAVDAYTKAIALAPNDSLGYEGRGHVRNILKDYRGAIQDFDRAIALNPKSATAFNLRGFARANSGDPKAALEDYAHAIELEPHYAAALRNRGDLRRTSGDTKGAMEDYNQALELAPKDQIALLGRGFLRLQAGDNAGAVADYDTYIAGNSKYFGAYFNRGLAREKLGDKAGALEDFHRTLELDPSMAAAKTNATRLEASLGATAGGAPAQPAQSRVVPKPIATSAPAPAASQGPRVLAPFSGYAIADPCMQAEARPGAPWDANASPAGGTVGAAELGQYQAMLRHTMEGLRLLYGPLSPKEENNFNAFWAPFFDHPTRAALDYFKRIMPVLDDMTVTLSNLDGMLPGMGEALQGTMLAGGDPASGASRVAAAQYQGLKTERARLDDLSKKITTLGNPPNPIEAKCNARRRHQQAFEAIGGSGEETAPTGEVFSSNMVGISLSGGDTWWAPRGYGNPKEGIPLIWQGRSFYAEFRQNHEKPESKYTAKDKEDRASGRYVWEESVTWIRGTLSADGRRVERLESQDESDWPNVVHVSVTDISFNQGEFKAVHAVAHADSPGAHEFPYMLRFPTGYGPPEVTYSGPFAGNWNAIPVARKGWLTITFDWNPNQPAVQHGGLPPFDGTSGTSATEKAKTGSQAAEPENDPQVKAEAIVQHLALAEQARRDGDRWAADAAKEKNSDRRQKLERLAAGSYATAQSEKDIAEGLRTGTMVHTRTEWDEQQHQTTVANIKNELAVFDAENKLLANIPKVADMVAGLDGVQLRDQVQKDITDAIHSPDPLKKLAAIYGKVQDKVVNQGQQEMAAAQSKVDMWDQRVAIAEKTAMAAGLGVTLGALWAPAEVGSVALGYAGATGFAEGGVKGAAVAVVRGVSSRVDVIISAYEGATKIDPTTHEPSGLYGAIEGALWSIGTNKAFETLGARIQQAKAEYAVAQRAAGSLGFKPMARAGEAQIKEFDFQTPEQRYKTELETAKTPKEQADVNRKYAIQVEREAMSTEREVARQKAEEAIRQGSDPVATKERYNQDLKAINDKYAAKETRNQEHQEVMKELGFDLSYDKNNTDIRPTGSNPKTAASDMDFTPQGKTPHEAYQKGKAYVETMKKRGHHVDEYGDRWVDATNDATIWKPGFDTDQPGSSSFEAEAIFGSLPNSDKFATKGGIEWTSSETHVTADPLGAVLANAGKAAGAGLGNSRPPDLHVIGKSAAKAAEAAGIEVDSQLKAQIDALKAHQTPEQAGVVDLGAGQATKDKQVQSFLGKVKALMGQAYTKAKAESDRNAQALEQKVAAAGKSDEAYKIRSQLKAYQASDEAAFNTIAQVAPGLAGQMAGAAKAVDVTSINLGGLARELVQDRDSDAQAPPLPADNNDPAFSDLGKRCKQAAQNVSAKLAAAKPGSDEARYMADLKAALEQGASHPAEAVRTVRGLTGTELAVVLAQLGVPAGAKSR